MGKGRSFRSWGPRVNCDSGCGEAASGSAAAGPGWAGWGEATGSRSWSSIGGIAGGSSSTGWGNVAGNCNGSRLRQHGGGVPLIQLRHRSGNLEWVRLRHPCGNLQLDRPCRRLGPFAGSLEFCKIGVDQAVLNKAVATEIDGVAKHGVRLGGLKVHLPPHVHDDQAAVGRFYGVRVKPRGVVPDQRGEL